MNERTRYVARINRVVDHIDAHLADALDLPTLADIAHFSPWHFHRLFQAFTGETLGERVRRRRLEVAAARLLASPPQTTLSIALDVGFGSAEAFTRAFKAYFHATPSGWRRGAHRAWFDAQRGRLAAIHSENRKRRQAAEEALREDARPWPSEAEIARAGGAMQVELQRHAPARVAYLRHVGPYGDPGIPQTWRRLDAWCQERGLYANDPAMYGLSHDSPDLTAPEQCRYDACVEIDASFRPEGEFGVQTLPGGLHACTQFTGTPDRIYAAWMALYADWLPDSGYQADDRPCVERYIRDASMDTRGGAFSCWLCLPVRAV